MKAVTYLAKVVVEEEEEEVLCFHIHCEHVFRYFGLLGLLGSHRFDFPIPFDDKCTQ